MSYSPKYSFLLPPLSTRELDDLEASIRLNGIQMPILVDEFDNIIDGWHRLQIAIKLQLSDPPITIKTGLSETQKVQLAVSLNKDRRQMSSSQLAALAVEVEKLLAVSAKERQGRRNDLLAEPDYTNNYIVELLPQSEVGKARDQAAAILGTNSRYVSDAKRLEQQAPDLFEEVKSGNKTIPQANREFSPPHVSYNSGNNEWYTPNEIILAAIRVMGTIDLDPASSEKANEVVNALRIYTKDDDGLTHSWQGNVWLNPPYAKDLIGKFIDKLCYHLSGGDVTEAILLVNNATETEWFGKAISYASMVCFPSSRIKFWQADGTKGQPLQGQALLYFGKSLDLFTEAFSDIGWIAQVIRK